jgi:pSer/pThr/pTyr-binding forkhead associated (FHA) protein
MPQTYGRLIVSLRGGQKQEFVLARASVQIGRSSINDIVLPDTNVSRAHVRLDCGPDGVTAVDLGSANGTRVNGSRINRHTLAPGDVLAVGQTTLRFEAAAPEAEFVPTQISTVEEIETTLEQDPLEMELEDTDRPRLVVHTPSRTWEISLEREVVTIGRGAENDVVIDSEKASRQHARIERDGDSFRLRDLRSANGTWLGERRVGEHLLQPGDTIRIGDARMIFKSGFSPEQLTVVDSMVRDRRPVVLVPGLMGSNLWRGSEMVWPNLKLLFTQPDIFSLARDEAWEPRGVVEEVVVVPNLIKLAQYSRVLDYLEEGLGYERGKDLFEFAYDFRRDVREASRRLGEAIERWGLRPPITLIAHSLGTLVSRFYVECLDGRKKIGRLILLGGPHFGVPRSMGTILTGHSLSPLGLLDEALRRVLATFPSIYQILPTTLCVKDQHGRPVDVLRDESWLPEPQRPLLREARRFREQIGTRSSVPAVCIFGYGLKTITSVTMERDSEGLSRQAQFTFQPGGDDVIPDWSGKLDRAEIHPVRQHHGVLYVDNDVKMRLKVELTR